MPPVHILNAPTRLMQHLGYGHGYAYDHDAPDRFSGQDYFPDGMARADLLPADRRGRGGRAEGSGSSASAELRRRRAAAT